MVYITVFITLDNIFVPIFVTSIRFHEFSSLNKDVHQSFQHGFITFRQHFHSYFCNITYHNSFVTKQKCPSQFSAHFSSHLDNIFITIFIILHFVTLFITIKQCFHHNFHDIARGKVFITLWLRFSLNFVTELHFSSLKIGSKGDKNVMKMYKMWWTVMTTYNGTVKTYRLCIRMSMSSLSMVMPLFELKSDKDHKLSMELKIV